MALQVITLTNIGVKDLMAGDVTISINDGDFVACGGSESYIPLEPDTFACQELQGIAGTNQINVTGPGNSVLGSVYCA